MSERGFDLKRDGTGILIFSVAAFFAVLICKAWSSEAPLSTATGTAVLADVWVSTLGVLPSLLFTAGMAFVGARLFLRADEDAGWVKSAGALALTSVALSILLGAFSASAGGKLGAAIGGSISSFTHVSVGVIIGLAALGAAIWIGWILPAREASVEPPSLLSTKKALKRDVADGVSRDEALALLPEDLNQDDVVLRKLDPTPFKAMPLSPYPEDVRLRGEIPAGAKPLQPKHVPVESESAHEAHSVYRWTAPAVEQPAHAPRADLARAAEPEPDLELEALALTEEWQDEKDLTDEDRFPVEPAAEEVTPLPIPPRPTWEQPSLFEAEDEPVDAYGTPLTLVESLRATAPATVDDEASDEVDDSTSNVARGVPRAVEEDRFDDEQDADDAGDEEDVEEEDEDSEYEAVGEDEEDEAQDDEDADDLEKDEETQEDLVEEFQGATESSDVAAEGDEADVEEVSVADDDLDEREELAPELEAEPALAELNPEVEIPSMVAARERRDAPQTSLVFETVAMRDVVLQPKEAPADKADRTRLVGGARNDLLLEAGCLFLDRGRVAVSMLQRQYAMDFDEACALLDEFQELGLIGPYLGGQRRDILMTREQWLEKVGARAGGEASRLADV